MDSPVATYHPVTPAKRAFADESARNSATPQSTVLGSQHRTTIQAPTSPLSMGSTHSSKLTILPSGLSRQASPTLSSVSSLSILSCTPPPEFSLDGTAQSSEQNPTAESTGFSGEQPRKKRLKLTPAEKELRRVEKEQKEREKAEQKAKKEEEKQVKDEERRRKDEVKEQKRREKEAEKQRIEEEKRKVEEEKEKKERAQKRIHSFFAKPKESASASTEAGKYPPDVCETSSKPGDDFSTTGPEMKNDYRRTFLPFALTSNTTWAPTSRYNWDAASMRHIQNTLDKNFQSVPDCLGPSIALGQSLALYPLELRPRGVNYGDVKDIIRRLTNRESNLIDSTTTPSVNPLQTLQKVPVRYIHFHEDIRPPYIGTYTKIDKQTLARAARDPFKKVRTDTDYDYDSEAEWEEPEDGEDLMSEGDSELESNDGADDMADFLDDEDVDNQISKKRIFSGDLEPVCSGLCWEDVKGASMDSNGKRTESSHNKLALLQGAVQLPIDPFSSVYWEKENDAKSAPKQVGSGMQPPRQPLQARPNIFINGNAAPMSDFGSAPDAKSTNTRAPPPRLLVGSELEEFKQAVADSDHTKIGLLAILKKQFPKVPKPVLSDTLIHYAERQGRTEKEKRWRIK